MLWRPNHALAVEWSGRNDILRACRLVIVLPFQRGLCDPLPGQNFPPFCSHDVVSRSNSRMTLTNCSPSTMEPTPDCGCVGGPIDIETAEPAESDASDVEDSPSFRTGDHVWMWCETIGGFRYQHHGIVMNVEEEIQRGGTKKKKFVLKIADFTAPENETFALPTSSASNITNTQENALARRMKSRKRKLPHWHGIRVTSWDGAEWHREDYPEQIQQQVEKQDGQDASCSSESTDRQQLVLQRVHFLMQRPDLIPPYELLESNCETVAVWCRTGEFRTHQVTGLLGGGKRNSAVATGAAAVAATVFPPMLPMVAVGVGIWAGISLRDGSNEDNWRERTRILNEEFDKWLKRQQSGFCAVM